MIISQILTKSLVVSLALSLACATNCSAKISTEQLQIEINKAKILPAGTQITTAINAAELTVSTYKTGAESDCKIDAMLIAKTAFDADPDLSRARVLFYDTRVPDTYYEVTVTVGDVAAFGAGKVSKEQLLSALEVKKMSSGSALGSSSSEPRSLLPGTQASSQNAPGAEQNIASSAASGTKTAVKSNNATPQKLGAAGRAIYSNYGVVLSYPTQWRPEYPRSGNTLVRFFLPAASTLASSVVEMHVYAQKAVSLDDIVGEDPRDTFEEASHLQWMRSLPGGLQSEAEQWQQGWQQERQDEWHEKDAKAQSYFMKKGQPGLYKSWRLQRRNKWSTLNSVALPASVSIGQNKSVHCQQRAYWIVPRMGVRDFVRFVAFNTSGCTIVLGLFCPETDASSASAQFEEFLAGVKLSPIPKKVKKVSASPSEQSL